ncbi:energy-coupling factor ABC transporter ATP-binding protein [Granulicoccus phenolivorans]|uniref:energy-coupling factor ABC transporter ATP-binding protein n=1 Tax=Granulicoccus phenolivorans TaxID=266854 RepID=UPI0006852B5F
MEVRGIDAAYLDHPVLAQVSLCLTGRTVLLGANGSGKTTLLRVLSGAHRPLAGEVLVGGTRLKHTRDGLRAHRRQVQLVLQDPDDQLFSADVAADVSFGPLNLGLPEAEVHDRVAEALALLQITHLAERPTHQLSYGERKRAAIAGAVAMRPQVLLLDEPTSGLDPQGVRELLATLAGLEAHGTMLVMATHDVDLALGWADQAAVVSGGGVVHGPAAELLNDVDLLTRARLHRPWPLELSARLAVRGLVPPGLRPRTLEEVISVLDAGPEH